MEFKPYPFEKETGKSNRKDRKGVARGAKGRRVLCVKPFYHAWCLWITICIRG